MKKYFITNKKKHNKKNHYIVNSYQKTRKKYKSSIYNYNTYNH